MGKMYTRSSISSLATFAWQHHC